MAKEIIVQKDKEDPGIVYVPFRLTGDTPQALRDLAADLHLCGWSDQGAALERMAEKGREWEPVT